MYQRQLQAFPIHPISFKMIQQGHPWITLDKFSEKFPPNMKFILAENRGRPCALCLHDPEHKHVRARVWMSRGNFQRAIQNFRKDFEDRLIFAIEKRLKSETFNHRENIVLVFGENDQIPGLFVTKLGSQFLVQYYSPFWKTYQAEIIKIIQKTFMRYNRDVDMGDFWIQHRSEGENQKEKPRSLNPNLQKKEFTIKEYGIEYHLNLGDFYDCGIYTDMAAIRSEIEPLLSSSKKVLNLYAYTGAFSLYALAKGAEHVTSVDLSETYISWLEKNLASNGIPEGKHQSLTMPTLEALKKLKNSNEKFNIIISDPPSSSSDGNKRTQALQEYEKLIPLYSECLEQNGKMILFLNTHKVGWTKFEAKIQEILQKMDHVNFKIIKKLYLSDDCPTLKGFPEGNYLKGIILEKV